ncbi:SGNH/GDSL hydrolase family protein [Microbacterium sp. JZ70]|uniref:SGNH hydrolase n=1 Tax=Microbacterium barkeri TaxID=33917 RepID=A0A9W6H048_9MICO|nr:MULTISPECIES: SGNH/GDSL hydrolase family protein [Microbacterium]MDI6942100.1 SGNH/GDSL hydrolase family protein [Microbacterium barkeri]MDR6875973.1 lysophospholipase L1-like esterase [Microbacterium barkeri]GLJ60091.1 SGNH hydrolase [Microbacterium barkeri]
MTIRYVAIGDSFTEGVGDELPDGRPRGWADIAAQGWADSLGEPIEYANLAIRGRLAWPIVEEQLEPALALRPTHLSFNGGGNDMLRPGVAIESIADAFSRVLARCDEEGVRLILLSGANPSAGLPLSGLIQRRGDELSAAVLRRIEGRGDVIQALNWPDRVLSRPEFWSADRLHMNVRGHHRVAARVLTALGADAPETWWDLPHEGVVHLERTRYYREHVLPWVKRRLTRRSSGDGRQAKYASWTTIAPAT